MSGFHRTHSRFEQPYRCYSFSSLPNNQNRSNLNYGGKIILPPSALAKLSMLNISYPMLFNLSNNSSKKSTHGGVLEFIAEEGRCYIPTWMINTLGLTEGSIIQVKNVNLQLGKFVKIQPQSVNFLEITDPKAVLENTFRNFSCLTIGDIITIEYNDTTYDILVLETQPSEVGVSIIETDLEVDFAAPKGYIEPIHASKTYLQETQSKSSSIDEHVIKDKQQFQSFVGKGSRLNGKSSSTYGYS